MAQPQENLSLVQRVAATIVEHQLLRDAQGVVVGVSGGADSVAMLSVLRELAAEAFPVRLVVGHLNHSIRAVAGEDAAFVQHLCNQWGLECHLAVADVPAEAARTGKGIEETARRVRYEFLADLARREQASVVAVAHHADDNAETILYRIIRGTGLTGLAGMPIERDLGGVRLVRPMLDCRRAEIETYLRGRGLSWREDETNRDESYRRNYIRRQLLPLIRQSLNPRVDEALVRLAQQVQSAESYLREQASPWLPADPGEAGVTLSLADLQAAHPALRSEVIMLAMERSGVPLRQVGADAIASACRLAVDPQAPPVNLPQGWRLVRQDAQLAIQPPPTGPLGAAREIPETPLPCPGRTVLPDGRFIELEVLDYDPRVVAEHVNRVRTARWRAGDEQTQPQEAEELLDAAAVVGQLSVRSRRDGDVFWPLGSPGRQSVSDFLTNVKLPPDARRSVLVMQDEKAIVYVAPLRIDQCVRVNPGTQRMIRVRVGKQEA